MKVLKAQVFGDRCEDMADSEVELEGLVSSDNTAIENGNIDVGVPAASGKLKLRAKACKTCKLDPYALHCNVDRLTACMFPSPLLHAGMLLYAVSGMARTNYPSFGVPGSEFLDCALEVRHAHRKSIHHFVKE